MIVNLYNLRKHQYNLHFAVNENHNKSNQRLNHRYRKKSWITDITYYFSKLWNDRWNN